MAKQRVIIIVAAIAVLAVLFLWGTSTSWYYKRMRGADLFIAQIERVERLTAIWLSLCEFKGMEGRFPESESEWSTYEPNVPSLLRAPKWTRAGSYVVHFERLGNAAGAAVESDHDLLVEDPGIRWPGNPDDSFDIWRVGLTPDGRIVSYNQSYPIHREPMECSPPTELNGAVEH